MRTEEAYGGGEVIEALVHPPLVLGQVPPAAGEWLGVSDAHEEEGEEHGDEASARRPHLLQSSRRRETFPFRCLFWFWGAAGPV